MRCFFRGVCYAHYGVVLVLLFVNDLCWILSFGESLVLVVLDYLTLCGVIVCSFVGRS